MTADGARSDYLTELFEKVFGNNTCNPFYNTYINQGSTCPHHTQCPVRHNFEFLMKEDVRKLLIQRIIEVCIKDKLVITSRDILNFIFDAVVSPDFDEKKLWNLLSNPAKFLETYISYTTPMLIFENRGTSSLIDCMTENAATSDNIEKRDCDVLDFYAADDITPIVLSELNGSEYSDILHSIGLSAIDNGRDPLKKYVYKFLRNYKKLTDSQELKADRLYLSFVQDLTREYLQSKSTLKRLRQTRDRLADEIAELQAQQDEKNADIERLKKEYSDQGGISLDEWKTLNTQLKEEEERRERINWERKATAAEILPFIIVGPLLDQVRPQIAREHEFKTWKAISESIQTDRFKNAVVSSVDKAGAPDAERLGSILYDDIIKFLLPANGWADFVPFFGLSDDDEMRVQAVLNRVSQFEIKKLLVIGNA